MPPLSSWKTPLVSPRWSKAKVASSSKGNFKGSIFSPRDCWIMSTARRRMVRVRSPRKSIFNNPASSTSPIDHWVMTSSLPLTRPRGTYSVSGLSLITTAAACVPTLRASPSIRCARSRSSLTSGSPWYVELSSALFSIAFPSEMPSSSGTIPVT